MKILSISDKEGSAIDRLGIMNIKRLPHLQITHFSVHPKRPEPAQLEVFRKFVKDADIIDCLYWKSATMLRKEFPFLFDGKKTILTHQNEHNIKDDSKNHWDWQDWPWDAIVAKNGWQKKELELAGYKPVFIRHAIEFDNFKIQPKLTEEKIVGMVGQIKKVKGVREAYQACRKLGYKLLLVGGASEADYFEALFKEGMANGDLLLSTKVPDDKLCEMYHQMRVFVCNSDDGTESGTLPILEAMLSGIPVVTRNIGHVRDFGKHMSNCYIHSGKYTDVDQLAEAIKLVMENDDIAGELRENAWRTVRQYNAEVQAREYNKLYHRVLYPDQHIVSVIIPTFNRAELLVQQFAALAEQTYKNFEVVICDDGSTDNTKAVVEEARTMYHYPIKYVQTGNYPKDNGDKAYGLAKARNLGLIEAIGEIIVFCDDRQKMHSEAIANFVNALKKFDHRKVWVWGNKGAFKTFVENFSATWKSTVVQGGMFNERIDEYGGMTQEVSTRFNAQGVKFEWAPQCVATTVFNTHSKSKHRQEIIRSKIKLYKIFS